MARRRRRTWGVWFSNWDGSALPFPERFQVALRNYALRLIRRRGCCGHDGEPGC